MGRSKASSCFLGGNIYVFGGHGQQEKYLSSVEQLRVTAVASQQADVQWRLIKQPPIFPTRYYCLVAPITDTQIVIMGGYNSTDGQMNDVWLFDIRNETTKKTAEGGPFTFDL